MTNDQLRYLASVLNDLHSKFMPHKTQKIAAHALFYQRMPRIFLENGRKWGKTDFICYILWRWAIFYPGSTCYYIAPFQKQAKEIIWAAGRIQNFIANRERYVLGRPNNSEMRINFHNGSFIKCDGSDNYEAYRGINPHLIIYDEFKDFRPEFHVAMAPNLAAHKAPIVIAGTPPERDDCQYVVIADQWKSDPDSSHFNFPSWENPYLDKEFLEREKKALYARGEGDVWEREYGAKRVKGGVNSIFPMFDEETHIVPHETLVEKLAKDRSKLMWAVIADPGNATVFGMLFCAFNPYKCEIYILDEIYETEQKNTSTGKIIPEMRNIREELNDDPEAWVQHYDEAATWFATEALASYNEGFFPTQKALNRKDQGLSLIKDQMLYGKVQISDRCKNLKSEITNYIRDKNGKIPKENDHLIDCWRYGNAAFGVTFVPEVEKLAEQTEWRAFTPENDPLINEDEDIALTPYMPYQED